MMRRPPRSTLFPSTAASRCADHAIFADRLLPGSFHLPQLTPSCLVVRFLAVLIFGVINFLLTLSRRGVVWIQTQHLIVAFHGKVIPARLIKAVCVSEPLFDLLHPLREGQRRKAATIGFADLSRLHVCFVGHRPAGRMVKGARLPPLRVELLRTGVFGIVSIA